MGALPHLMLSRLSSRTAAASLGLAERLVWYVACVNRFGLGLGFPGRSFAISLSFSRYFIAEQLPQLRLGSRSRLGIPPVSLTLMSETYLRSGSHPIRDTLLRSLATTPPPPWGRGRASIRAWAVCLYRVMGGPARALVGLAQM